jgi:hypothetical protein
MPLFEEGQDPLGSPQTPVLQFPRGEAPKDPFAGPTASQAIGAAFRLESPIVSVLNALEPATVGDRDPEWNPLTLVKDRPDVGDFVGDRNEAETRARLARKEREAADREVLEQSGTFGTVAAMGAGLLDPTIALPAGGFIRAARGGYSFWRSAASVGAASGVQAGFAEGLLQASQEDRTAEESAIAIGAGTVLGGLIGGGAASMLSRGERRALEEAFEIDRRAISRGAGLPETPPVTTASPSPAVNTNIGIAQAAGAAAADVRTLGLEPLLPRALEAVIPPSLREMATDLLVSWSPTQRIFTSDWLSAKRAMADLSETALRFTEAEQGITPSHGGPPISRMATQQVTAHRLQTSDTLQEAFTAYRYGEEPGRAPLARSMVEDFRGRAGDKLSYADFKTEVFKALNEGDVHPIPEVQRAAKVIRERTLEPIKRVLVDSGFRMEGFEVKGAKSYAPTVWNREAFIGRRDEAVKRITDWYTSDQTEKAAIKARIADLDRQRTEILDRIDKIEDDFQRRELELQVDALRERIEQEIRSWKGDTAAEAISSLKARDEAEEVRAAKQEAGTYKGPGERLRSADRAVERAVKRMLASDRDLSSDELRSRAEQTVDRIIGSPDGRLPYDLGEGGPQIGAPRGFEPPPRGALQSRDFAIPRELMYDFMETDIEHVMSSYLRTVIPDLMLHQRFGDVNMTNAIRNIHEEAQAKAAGAKTEAERQKIHAERDRHIRDLAATRDRVRGTYGWSPDLRMRQAARFSHAAKQYSVIVDLGTAMLNSMGDMSGAVFRYGFMNVLRDAWLPFFSGMIGVGKLSGAAKRQARAMHIAVETDLNLRSHQLSDVLDTYRPGSKFERGLQWAADKSQLVNGQAWFTDRVKSMAATVSGAEILRATRRVVSGTANKKEIGNLAASGIDPQMARRIWDEFSNGGGDVIDGVPLPNTADWKDGAVRAAFEAAVGREADIAVVTPGVGDKPLWMSSPVASVLGQFKGFIAATHERTLLAQLQQRDARTLSGLFASVGFGMLSYQLYSLASGKETSKRPQDWIKEGISRSGVMGWFDEINSVTAKASAGHLDVFRLVGAGKELSRFESRSPLGSLLGPTAGKIEGLTGTIGAAFRGDWKASDTSQFRRLIPLQNHFLLRGMINEMEEGLNNHFNIAPKIDRPVESTGF